MNLKKLLKELDWLENNDYYKEEIYFLLNNLMEEINVNSYEELLFYSRNIEA